MQHRIAIISYSHITGVGRSTFYTIIFCYCLVAVSMGYFISLWASVPLWGALIFCTGLTIIGVWCALRLSAVLESPCAERQNWWPVAILLAGLTIIVYKSYLVEHKAGHWDAWWFWNMRANFLTQIGR